MSDTSLGKASPHMGYGSMAGIIIAASERFLGWFQMSIQSSVAKGASASLPDDFLSQFLVEADAFATSCCRELATMLRETSTQAELRETSEPVLAKLIRNRCLDALDSILVGYVEVLMELRINLGGVQERLGDSRVRDALAHPAPVNLDQGEQRTASARRGRTGAVLKILEYIDAFDSLPRELLDYGGVKLFGAEADFNMQKDFVLSIQDGIQPKYQAALGSLEGFEEIKKKRWEDQRSAESAVVKEAAMNALMAGQTKRSSLGSWRSEVFAQSSSGWSLAAA
ncbi:MAG: hypothetical protein FJ403_00290 [Verrucomicrobia bacterium]|nr:hypothetical protein [Verrucomicrobiota bacterium]